MNKIKTLIAMAALPLMYTITAHAQTADEIVAKHIAAVGGADSWHKVKTLRMSGSMNISGMDVAVVITTVENKGQRVEYSANGVTGYQIVTPKAGWSCNPGETKATAMPAEALKAQQEGLELEDELLAYKERKAKIVLAGKEKVDDKDCYKLTITSADGKVETMYIDATTYYHVRTVKKGSADGQDQDQVSVYNDFKTLPEGIVFPMSVDDGGGLIKLTSVEVNKPVDEVIFVPKS